MLMVPFLLLFILVLRDITAKDAKYLQPRLCDCGLVTGTSIDLLHLPWRYQIYYRYWTVIARCFCRAVWVVLSLTKSSSKYVLSTGRYLGRKCDVSDSTRKYYIYQSRELLGQKWGFVRSLHGWNSWICFVFTANCVCFCLTTASPPGVVSLGC